MKVQLIKYNTGYLGISDENISFPSHFYSAMLNETYYVNKNNGAANDNLCIIFTTPDLELEGVPLIDLIFDKCEEEAIKYVGKHYANLEKYDDFEEWEHFCNGYNKAKELYKFTEEDVKKAIKLSQLKKLDDACDFVFEHTTNEIITQLSEPKAPIAVDIEEERRKGICFPKTQVINKKKYCLINKIYYK